MKRWALVIGVLLLGACSHKAPQSLLPAGLPGQATAQEIDSLWALGQKQYEAKKWKKAEKTLERLVQVISPGDPRSPQAHFVLGECYLKTNSQLQAVREFRRVADDTPNQEQAADALLRAGDAYASLWRRPELDPTYGQTAIATYQELLNRYPGTPAAEKATAQIAKLNSEFAYKEYKTALFYLRLKAYDSGILYLKDLVATYPRADIVPDALVKLVEVYQRLGYSEDVNDTCGYLRRYHPATKDLDKVCPAPVPADST